MLLGWEIKDAMMGWSNGQGEGNSCIQNFGWATCKLRPLKSRTMLNYGIKMNLRVLECED